LATSELIKVSDLITYPQAHELNGFNTPHGNIWGALETLLWEKLPAVFVPPKKCPQVAAGPSTATTSFVLTVTEKTTLLRYRIQSKHYELFQRRKKTSEKIPRREGEFEEDNLLPDELEETPGVRSRGKKRKLFGVVEARVFPKLSKVAAAKERKTLSAIGCSETTQDDSATQKSLLECSSLIQHILTSESASSLMFQCPQFFSKVTILKNHMLFLTGGCDIFLNCQQHYEFQMELIFEYLISKLPKNVCLSLSAAKDEQPSGNGLFAFHMKLLQNLAALWHMDPDKLFFPSDAEGKCHKDLATPHGVFVGNNLSAISIFVDSTRIYAGVTLVDAIPILVALHFAINVHYDKDVHLMLELLQKQFCILSPKEGSHRAGKEGRAQQSAEIQSYQTFIGKHLYDKEIAARQ
jgi:hypothetical protein